MNRCAVFYMAYDFFIKMEVIGKFSKTSQVQNARGDTCLLPTYNMSVAGSLQHDVIISDVMLRRHFLIHDVTIGEDNPTLSFICGVMWWIWRKSPYDVYISRNFKAWTMYSKKNLIFEKIAITTFLHGATHMTLEKLSNITVDST